MQYELHGWHNSDYYNHAACMNKQTLQNRFTYLIDRGEVSKQWIRRIIHVTNWMAGPILTSSPHYFSAVKILLCLFSEKLAGSGYQTKDPQITLPI